MPQIGSGITGETAGSIIWCETETAWADRGSYRDSEECIFRKPAEEQRILLTANECGLGGTFTQPLGDRPVAAGAPAGSRAATGCIKKQ